MTQRHPVEDVLSAVMAEVERWHRERAEERQARRPQPDPAAEALPPIPIVVREDERALVAAQREAEARERVAELMSYRAIARAVHGELVRWRIVERLQADTPLPSGLEVCPGSVAVGLVLVGMGILRSEGMSLALLVRTICEWWELMDGQRQANCATLEARVREAAHLAAVPPATTC